MKFFCLNHNFADSADTKSKSQCVTDYGFIAILLTQGWLTSVVEGGEEESLLPFVLSP